MQELAFIQFPKERVGEQQRMNLSQDGILTNGPEVGTQRDTQTGDLAVHLLPVKIQSDTEGKYF